MFRMPIWAPSDGVSFPKWSVGRAEWKGERPAPGFRPGTGRTSHVYLTSGNLNSPFPARISFSMTIIRSMPLSTDTA